MLIEIGEERVTQFKYLILTIVGLLGSAQLIGQVLAADVRGVTETEIIVGSHSDMTGPEAELGIAIRFGTALAFEEVNRQGGVHGRTLRFIAEDTSGSPEKAHRAIRKLLTEDQVFAVLSPHGTLPVQATLDVMAKSNVPHLFPFAAPTIMSDNGNAYRFTISPTFEQQLRLSFAHLASEHELVDVGVIYQAGLIGENLAGALDTVAAKQGLTVASKNRYEGDHIELKTLVSRLYANSVDAIVLQLPPQTARNALEEIAQYKWVPRILCVGGCYDQRFASEVGSNLEGVYTVSHLPKPLVNDPKDSIREWWQIYQRRFGREPNRYALDAYIRAHIFIAALQHIGRRPTPEMLVQGLEGMPAWSDWRLTGNTFDFSASSHVGAQKAFLAQYQSGKWIPVTDYSALHAEEMEDRQAAVSIPTRLD